MKLDIIYLKINRLQQFRIMIQQENGLQQLDQLIQIINRKKTQPQAWQLDLQYKNANDSNTRKQLPPLEQKLKLDGNQNNSLPKFLIFKPWSGQITYSEQNISLNSQAIKQQIQNEEDDNQLANCQYQKQDYMQESKIFIGNIAASNQIGYFYKFQAGKVKLIKCLLDENGFKDCHINSKNWTLYWSCTPIKMDVYRGLLPYQKINHFPNSFNLTRKDLMNKTVSKMQVKYGVTHYNFLPKTFILPQQMNQLEEQINKHCQTYIVKPHNRSQGKGITVTNSLQTIYEKLSKYSSLIVSHYIGNPLLINKLKFDLRIYVAILGINPLRIYVYEEGLARFATQQYDSSGYDSQNKKYQHLTNYSINKKNSQFVPSNNQNQQYYGSKWSLSAMKDFLSFNIGKQQTADLFQRIDEVIVKTIISAQNLLYTSFQNNVSYINACFQVLGFDIMIDSNLKPWLIEVNHSPSMNTDSTLDLKIKGNMIADLFTMTGVTPLSQRYLNGGHSKYQSRHYFNTDKGRGNQSAVDKFILKEIQMQNQRRGGWRRVFPIIKNLKYKQYFETDRYYNKLLRQQLSAKEQPIVNRDTASIRNQYRSHTVGKSSSGINYPQNTQTNIQNNKAPSNIRLNRIVKGTYADRISGKRASQLTLM